MPKTLTRKITRRNIQIALGVLWFIDGVLQLQHQMFTANFAYDVIAPAAQGQPAFISDPMHWFIKIFLHSPFFFNACVALIQLGLGVGIISKRTTKYALLASVAWGLFVWYVGEGLGGLFNESASLWMGLPGAALLYALIALAVLPEPREEKKARESHDRPAFWLSIVWAVLWLGGAAYQLLPGQNSVAALRSMVIAMTIGAPAWMVDLNFRVAHILHDISTGQHGSFWFIILLATLEACVGLAVFIPGTVRKLAIGLGILLALVFWVIGEALGGYYTGLATDPSTGPLIILLGIAVLGLSNEFRLALLSDSEE